MRRSAGLGNFVEYSEAPMSDASVAVSVGATTGAVSMPVLAAFGINVEYMACGLVGCIIVQSLLPSEHKVGKKPSVWAISFMTIGSVLFASLVGPVFGPWAVESMASKTVPDWAIRALSGAFLGGFAQPLILGVRTHVVPRLIGVWKAAGSALWGGESSK